MQQDIQPVTGGGMTNPSIEALKKQMHDEEREVEAMENKIAFADLSTTYPHEYTAMRTEQEHHRQSALKCKASLDDESARPKTD
jgi:hypothetical protein